jgi:hypothetical protein
VVSAAAVAAATDTFIGTVVWMEPANHSWTPVPTLPPGTPVPIRAYWFDPYVYTVEVAEPLKGTATGTVRVLHRPSQPLDAAPVGCPLWLGNTGAWYELVGLSSEALFVTRFARELGAYYMLDGTARNAALRGSDDRAWAIAQVQALVGTPAPKP